MTGGAEVKGVARLRATLDTAGRELADLDATTGVRAGQLLAAAGAARSPRRSGFLADSHGFTVTDAGVSVVVAAPYAGYVHAANPWLVRELDAQEETIVTMYAADVADVVAKIQGA